MKYIFSIPSRINKFLEKHKNSAVFLIILTLISGSGLWFVDKIFSSKQSETPSIILIDNKTQKENKLTTQNVNNKVDDAKSKETKSYKYINIESEKYDEDFDSKISWKKGLNEDEIEKIRISLTKFGVNANEGILPETFSFSRNIPNFDDKQKKHLTDIISKLGEQGYLWAKAYSDLLLHGKPSVGKIITESTFWVECGKPSILKYDFNKDGKNDELRFVTIPPNYSASLTVKINNERFWVGPVQPHTGLDQFDSSIVQLALGDVTGDGEPEILVGTYGPMDNVYLNIYSFNREQYESKAYTESNSPFKRIAVLYNVFNNFEIKDKGKIVCFEGARRYYKTLQWRGDKFEIINYQFYDYFDPEYKYILEPDEDFYANKYKDEVVDISKEIDDEVERARNE